MTRTARVATIQVDRHGNPYGPSHYYLQTCPQCVRLDRPAQSMTRDPAATVCTVDRTTTPRPVPRVMGPQPGWAEWQATLDPVMRHPDYVALIETGHIPALPFFGPWPEKATWWELRNYELILGPS